MIEETTPELSPDAGKLPRMSFASSMNSFATRLVTADVTTDTRIAEKTEAGPAHEDAENPSATSPEVISSASPGADNVEDNDRSTSREHTPPPRPP